MSQQIYTARRGSGRNPDERKLWEVLTVDTTVWHADARPEIVTLCGSTKFRDAFLAEQKRLTLEEGAIVISVGTFGHLEGLKIEEDDGSPTPLKIRLDELHKRKIDLCDRVVVINPEGYLGASTRSEIRYAWSVAHKPVSFTWYMPDSHHDGFSHGICAHGEARGNCIGMNSYDIG